MRSLGGVPKSGEYEIKLSDLACGLQPDEAAQLYEWVSSKSTWKKIKLILNIDQSPPPTLRKKTSSEASLKVSEAQKEILKVENPSTTKREDQKKIEEFIYRQFVRLRNVPPELRTTENERVVQQYKQLNIGRSAVPAHIESFKKYRQSEKRKDDQLKVDPGAKGWVYYLDDKHWAF